jgi:DNA-binding PadR family transcriptional regulator
MPPRLRSNPLALAVLVSLYERPMHPYQIAQTLRSRAKHESIRLNYGSLYNVVESLEARGLIQVREVVREGRRPERTIYEITPAGAREMSDWLGELVSVPVKEYTSFEAAVSLIGALPPDDALAGLRERRSALEWTITKNLNDQQTGRQIGLPRLFLLESEYQNALQRAELAFVEALIADIEGGSLDGLEFWRAMFDGNGPPPQFELARPAGSVEGSSLPHRPVPDRPETGGKRK